jgi:hypothetical protein
MRLWLSSGHRIVDTSNSIRMRELQMKFTLLSHTWLNCGKAADHFGLHLEHYIVLPALILLSSYLCVFPQCSDMISGLTARLIQ